MHGGSTTTTDSSVSTFHLTLIDEAARGIADLDTSRTMRVPEVRGTYENSPKRKR
jgi:hypothetical protein